MLCSGASTRGAQELACPTTVRTAHRCRGGPRHQGRRIRRPWCRRPATAPMAVRTVVGHASSWVTSSRHTSTTCTRSPGQTVMSRTRGGAVTGDHALVRHEHVTQRHGAGHDRTGGSRARAVRGSGAVVVRHAGEGEHDVVRGTGHGQIDPHAARAVVPSRGEVDVAHRGGIREQRVAGDQHDEHQPDGSHDRSTAHGHTATVVMATPEGKGRRRGTSYRRRMSENLKTLGAYSEAMFGGDTAAVL